MAELGRSVLVKSWKRDKLE